MKISLPLYRSRAELRGHHQGPTLPVYRPGSLFDCALALAILLKLTRSRFPARNHLDGPDVRL